MSQELRKAIMNYEKGNTNLNIFLGLLFLE